MVEKPENNNDSPQDESEQSFPVREISADNCEETTVEYTTEPPSGVEGRKIHPRREVPQTPESPDDGEIVDQDD